MCWDLPFPSGISFLRSLIPVSPTILEDYRVLTLRTNSQFSCHFLQGVYVASAVIIIRKWGMTLRRATVASSLTRCRSPRRGKLAGKKRAKGRNRIVGIRVTLCHIGRCGTGCASHSGATCLWLATKNWTPTFISSKKNLVCFPVVDRCHVNQILY